MAVNALAARSPDVPPQAAALLFELPRAAWNLASLAGSGARLHTAPSGDGRPVMVLPGLFNSDRSNIPLRRFLARIGYRSYAWKLGRNLGERAVGPEAERLIARIEAIRDETGEPVTLVGVSLGGVMARFVAARRPDLVREVITVSAPFAGPPTSTRVWRQFQWLTGKRIDDPAVTALQHEAAGPLAVPSTALWSRTDGLVNGLICRNENCRSIEIASNHIGVQFKPEVLLTVAKVLAGAV